MDPALPAKAVKRVGRAKEPVTQREEVAEGLYRGFGAVRGETVEEFHERMYDLNPIEAMVYEAEHMFERLQQ